MSNGSDIVLAQLNVTIDTIPWTLVWNGTSGYYEAEFTGSDDPPGLGTHTLYISADKYGYVAASDDTESLTLREDPTTLIVTWSDTNTITYVQHSYLIVNYRMSNGSEITTGLIVVTIGPDDWTIFWNSTAGAYTLRFAGADDPPGLGTFSVRVDASLLHFESRTTFSSLSLIEDPASVSPSWTSISFDWTESVILSFDYTDSQGNPISDATQKDVFIDGVPYTLSGTNGTYWIVLTNSFDLGLHAVTANLSKFGYTFAYEEGISFAILQAETTLALDWSSLSIDYLGQIHLEAAYGCVPTGSPVPLGDVMANISIDGGVPIPLSQMGSVWTANLTGVSLDLGTHDVVVSAWAYGYVHKEDSAELTVTEVVTDSLAIMWNPVNLTIEYLDTFTVTVDYTYYGGDVPEPAEVNVTVSGQTYWLSYTGVVWTGTIPGAEIGLGIHTADFRASAYGFALQSAFTMSLNVTQAANSFYVIWEPIDLQPSYVDMINLSVVYTQDFSPIDGATVLLTINGSDLRPLTYSSIDEMWHLSIDASSLGLGVWNMTVTANKTGYADGLHIDFLTIRPDVLFVSSSWDSETTDYITPITLRIQLNASDGTPVNEATVDVTLDGVTRSAAYLSNGLYEVVLGPLVDIGVHTVNVTFQGPWFYTGHEYVTLDVTEAASTLTVLWSNQTIHYTELASAGAFYQMTNGSPIAGLPIVTINSSTLTATWASDHWEFDVNGTLFGLGTFVCRVNVSAYGFVSRSSDFVIAVLATPTSAEVHQSPIHLRINESTALLVDFEDLITSSPITDASTFVEWFSACEVTDLRNGTYEIVFSASGLQAGSYSLNVTLGLYGYENSTAIATIIVEIRPLSAIYETPLSQYENETLIVWVQVFDSLTAQPILHADVTATLDGIEYDLVYEESAFRYQVEIWLDSSFAVGSYEVSLDIVVDDYHGLSPDIPLEILEKGTYSISLEIDDDIVAGGDFTASFTVTEEGASISGVSIRVVLVVYSQAGDSQIVIASGITDMDGHGHVTFEIPLSAVQGTVRADYLGSISVWPAQSQEIELDIRRPGLDILSFILSNPIALVAVGGIGVVSVILLRRRGGVHSSVKSAVEVSSAATPAPPLTDTQRVRHAIRSQAEGMTRQEISQSTGLSSAKVGEIIRDLLASDRGFFEWREGRQRLIRYRFEE